MGTRPSKRQYAFDITLAVGFAALALLQLVIPADGYAMGPLWLEIALALTSSLPLAFRRIRPLLVAVAMFAPQIVASLFVAHLATFWGTLLPLAVAIYTCVRYSLAPLPAALAILALPAAFLVAYDVRTPAFGTWEDYAFAAVVFGAAWISGRVTRHLLQQRRALKEALRALEGQAAERRQQALLTERTRIAREMHDVVAHGISVMVVQAGSARLELGGHDESARASLLAIEDTGRRVLDELRRTVLLLRSEGDIADGRPAPGLADIPALVDTMRAAGLDVALTMDAATADDGRGLAAYRVVQEALTNVLRHAHGAAVTVQVTGDPDLHIAVVDTGPARGHALDASELTGGTGHGLVGIAERVEMYGGELMVERGAGEFAVRARIPARVS